MGNAKKGTKKPKPKSKKRNHGKGAAPQPVAAQQPAVPIGAPKSSTAELPSSRLSKKKVQQAATEQLGQALQVAFTEKRALRVDPRFSKKDKALANPIIGNPEFRTMFWNMVQGTPGMDAASMAQTAGQSYKKWFIVCIFTTSQAAAQARRAVISSITSSFQGASIAAKAGFELEKKAQTVAGSLLFSLDTKPTSDNPGDRKSLIPMKSSTIVVSDGINSSVRAPDAPSSNRVVSEQKVNESINKKGQNVPSQPISHNTRGAEHDKGWQDLKVKTNGEESSTTTGKNPHTSTQAQGLPQSSSHPMNGLSASATQNSVEGIDILNYLDPSDASRTFTSTSANGLVRLQPYADPNDHRNQDDMYNVVASVNAKIRYTGLDFSVLKQLPEEEIQHLQERYMRLDSFGRLNYGCFVCWDRHHLWYQCPTRVCTSCGMCDGHITYWCPAGPNSEAHRQTNEAASFVGAG